MSALDWFAPGHGCVRGAHCASPIPLGVAVPSPPSSLPFSPPLSSPSSASSGPVPNPVPNESGSGALHHPSFLHEFFDGFTWTQGAVILAALIAAVGVAATILTTSARARRDRLADIYAEALSAVSEYNEGPYRIRRRSHGNHQQRFGITSALSDVKARIDHSQNMLELHAPAGVAAAYAAYAAGARREAGRQMHEAWNSPGIAEDTDVNLHVPFPRTTSEPLRVHVLAVMQADLARRILKPWTLLRYRRCVKNPAGPAAAASEPTASAALAGAAEGTPPEAPTRADGDPGPVSPRA